MRTVVLKSSLSLLFTIYSAHAQTGPTVGYVTGLAGSSGNPQVEVKTESGALPAERDHPFQKNNHLTTGPDSSAAIELNDGTVILLGPKSELAVISVAGKVENATRLQLVSGLLHLMVSKIYGSEKTFVLSGGNWAMAVHGTEFIAEQPAGKGAATCNTLDGTVVMAAHESDLVNAAKSVIVSVGEKSDLKPGDAKPSPAVKFQIQSFLEKLDLRAPSLKTLREQSMSKFSASTHPAPEHDDEAKPKPQQQRSGQRRRRGMGI